MFSAVQPVSHSNETTPLVASATTTERTVNGADGSISLSSLEYASMGERFWSRFKPDAKTMDTFCNGVACTLYPAAAGATMGLYYGASYAIGAHILDSDTDIKTNFLQQLVCGAVLGAIAAIPGATFTTCFTLGKCIKNLANPPAPQAQAGDSQSNAGNLNDREPTSNEALAVNSNTAATHAVELAALNTQTTQSTADPDVVEEKLSDTRPDKVCDYVIGPCIAFTLVSALSSVFAAPTLTGFGAKILNQQHESLDTVMSETAVGNLVLVASVIILGLSAKVALEKI